MGREIRTSKHLQGRRKSPWHQAFFALNRSLRGGNGLKKRKKMAPPKRGGSWLLPAAGLDDGVAGADQGHGHGGQGDAEVADDCVDAGDDRRAEGGGHECDLDELANLPFWGMFSTAAPCGHSQAYSPPQRQLGRKMGLK
ncbi:protein of unknown function [Pseudodesulfovibrio profundus]|uniref:Uncharacterized protein n=1 Tax=Pseudodesulfovibrio profundus TaxID=57320 RepID=A0A2C8F4W6_9BACT|nr:protein of unknown function [Pseudodesulfovibrio profundus]